MDIYTYINKIDNTDKFRYCIYLIAAILFMQRLSLRSETVIGLVVGIIIIYYINERSIKEGSNFMENMDHSLKAKAFKGTKNLHVDSQLLTFLYDIREFRYYNPANFRKLVFIIDHFLKIVQDMEKGVKHMGENYQIAVDYKYRALNCLHSIIYKMPHSTATNNKFHTALSKLEDLLNFHLNNIYQYMVYGYGQEGININTKFIYKNQPAPKDSSFDKHYEFF